MKDLLKALGIEVNMGATTGATDGRMHTHGSDLVSQSPIDGQPIARVTQATADDYRQVMEKAVQAFESWGKRGRILIY